MNKKFEIENFLKGMKQAIGLAGAFAPFGLTLGLIAKSFDMPIYLVFLMSALIYSGSAETLLLKMYFVDGSNLLECLIATTVINLRYMVIGIPIFDALKNEGNKFQKFLTAILMTDETVIFLNLKKNKNVSYALGVNTAGYLSFVFSTLLGGMFGEIIPDIVSNSMKFVMYGIFLIFLITAIKSEFRYIRIVIITVIVKLLFMYLPGLKEINAGISTFVIILISSLTYAQLFYKEGEIQ